MSQDNETLHTRKVSREEWNGFVALARLDGPGDGLNRCIQSAYLTMNRTLVGIAKSPNADDWRRSMTDCLREKLAALTCRPTWNQDEFDTWHRDTASRLVQTAENPDFDFTVGQAQKWINVSIKNAVALGDRLMPSLSCVYDVAHVALDRIVLGELRRRDWMPRRLLQGPWSQLTDYGEYMMCQRLIRENLPGIPLEEEFHIWEEGRRSNQPAGVLYQAKGRA